MKIMEGRRSVNHSLTPGDDPDVTWLVDAAAPADLQQRQSTTGLNENQQRP